MCYCLCFKVPCLGLDSTGRGTSSVAGSPEGLSQAAEEKKEIIEVPNTGMHSFGTFSIAVQRDFLNEKKERERNNRKANNVQEVRGEFGRERCERFGRQLRLTVSWRAGPRPPVTACRGYDSSKKPQ